MKRLIVILAVLFAGFSVVGQSPADTIYRQGRFFVQNDKEVTRKQMVEVMKVNPEACKQMQYARSNYFASNIFGFIGGGFIGWPLGTLAGDGYPNWTLVGIGAGFVALSVPFAVSYSKQSKNAIRIYNNGLTQTGLRKINMDVGLANNGIGMKMKF